MMFSSSKVKTYALKKDKFISISLQTQEIKIKKDIKDIKIKEKKFIEKKVIKTKSSEAISSSENLDVEDLFSDVWTKKIVTKTKEIKQKRVEQKLINSKLLKVLEKKLKPLEKNQKKSVTKNIQEIEKTKEKLATSSALEINEYFAKIKALVYKYFYPPSNTEGFSVKAVIELTAFGKVKDFRILNYSSNENFNKECEKVKERLLRVIFPLNPKNKSSTTIVILTSKE